MNTETELLEISQDLKKIYQDTLNQLSLLVLCRSRLKWIQKFSFGEIENNPNGGFVSGAQNLDSLQNHKFDDFVAPSKRGIQL